MGGWGVLCMLLFTCFYWCAYVVGGVSVLFVFLMCGFIDAGVLLI